MDLDNTVSTDTLPATALPHLEPRKLTDPRTMRAVAHPVRIALLEALATEGPLTATQAGELIGESPTTCSFHLRQLAKYGFIEEAGGGPGRQRPWRLIYTGLRFSDVSDDPETRVAARALHRVLRDLYISRIEQGEELRVDLPAEWQEVTGSSEYLLYICPDELRALDEQLRATLTQYRERLRDRSKRPRGSQPIELILFAYPRAPRRMR